MVKINKKVEYALIILGYLLRKGKAEANLVCAKEVCDRFDLSFDVTSKVMQVLAQNGVLRSVKGAHGGYALEKSPDAITLYELNHMIVGPIAVASCLHEEGECELAGSCNIIAPMMNLNDRIEELYREIKLADLLSDKNRSRFENGEKALREKVLAGTRA